MSRPFPMRHLPGFWESDRWSREKWNHYLERRRKRGAWRERLDQALHRIMGRIFSRAWWERREAEQWPSKTGSYDPAMDHFHFLLGKAPSEAGPFAEEVLRHVPRAWRREYAAFFAL